MKRICRACDVVFETPSRLVHLVRGLQFVVRGEPEEGLRLETALLYDQQIATFLYREEKPRC